MSCFTSVLLRKISNHLTLQKKEVFGQLTGKMRQLVVIRRICCCSQFMIFLDSYGSFGRSLLDLSRFIPNPQLFSNIKQK